MKTILVMVEDTGYDNTKNDKNVLKLSSELIDCFEEDTAGQHKDHRNHRNLDRAGEI